MINEHTRRRERDANILILSIIFRWSHHECFNYGTFCICVGRFTFCQQSIFIYIQTKMSANDDESADVATAEDRYVEEANEPDPQFEPLVTLPLIDLITNEEGKEFDPGNFFLNPEK